MENQEKIGPILREIMSNHNRSSSSKPYLKLRVMIKLTKPGELNELRSIDDIQIGEVTGSIVTATLPLEQLQRVISLDGVKFIESSRKLKSEKEKRGHK